nr:hypothetical protein Cplu_355 [Cedratvirus plubellavi]
MEYILFCAQDALFQTRSMLVPYHLFPQEYLTLLSEHAVQTKEVDNLILIEVVGQCFPRTEICSLVNKLTMYADGVDDEAVPLWYKEAKINLVSGFNHISNYNKLRKRQDVKEGFLVLLNFSS